LKEYVESWTKKLGLPPRYGEVFNIEYNFKTEFADALWDDAPVTAPKANTSISIITVMRYMLVKYVSLAGSLSRFTTCNVCGALIFQNIRDDKMTCSSRCRARASRQKIPEKEKNMLKCRRRQNTWVTSKVLNHEVFRKKENLDIEPQTLNAAECRDLCYISGDEYPDRGKCLILQSKNPAVITLLEEFAKSGRKRSSNKI
jgi:predicted nucleic acid-binding Zn ribbon protein